MYLLSKLRSFHIYQTEGECSYTPSFRDKCIQTIELLGKLQYKHRSCTALKEGGIKWAAEVGQGWGKRRAGAGQG